MVIQVNTATHGIRRVKVGSEVPVFDHTGALTRAVVYRRHDDNFLAVLTINGLTYLGFGRRPRLALLDAADRAREWKLQAYNAAAVAADVAPGVANYETANPEDVGVVE